MKTGWIVSEIFNVFSGFPCDICTATSIHAAHLLIDLECFDHNPVKKSRISLIICEKIYCTCFALHLEKKESEAKFWGENINLYCVPIRIVDPLEFYDYVVFCEIFTFTNSWPWKCRSRSWCTTFEMTPFDCKYMTFYPMAIVIFALSLTVCEVCAKQTQIPTFWPWKRRSRSNSRRTGLAPFDWKNSNSFTWFLQHFSYTVYAKGHTHTHTHTYTHIHTYTQRETGVIKCCLFIDWSSIIQTHQRWYQLQPQSFGMIFWGFAYYINLLANEIFI